MCAISHEAVSGDSVTTRERVLLILAVQQLGRRLSLRHQQLLSYLPPAYPARSFYALAGRLVREKLVQRIKATQGLRLTTAGFKVLADDYGHLGLAAAANGQTEWRGEWQLAIYDVAEKDRYVRDKIRGALGRMGFGPLARSVYLSPYDLGGRVREFLAKDGLLGVASVVTAKHEFAQDARALASRVWELPALAEAYADVLRRFQIIRGQQLPEKRAAGMRAVRAALVELLGRDPFLPRELLPADWPRDRVREEIAAVDGEG